MPHPGRYNQLQCFVYWTDCAIASYSGELLNKSTSDSDLSRLKSIAYGMLEDLRRFTPTGDETREIREAKEEYDQCYDRLKKCEVWAQERADAKAAKKAEQKKLKGVPLEG